MGSSWLPPKVCTLDSSSTVVARPIWLLEMFFLSLLYQRVPWCVTSRLVSVIVVHLPVVLDASLPSLRTMKTRELRTTSTVSRETAGLRSEVWRKIPLSIPTVVVTTSILVCLLLWPRTVHLDVSLVLSVHAELDV